MTAITPQRYIDQRVRYAERAYAEALSAAREGGESTFTARQVAARAWHNNLPALTSRINIRAFIAATCRGLQASIIDAKEAKLMLFAAQTALSATPKPTKGEPE